MRSMFILATAAVVAFAAAMGPSLADAQSHGKAKGSSTSRTLNTLGQQMLSPGTGGASNLLSVGQHLPAGFNNFTQLAALPGPVRSLLPRGMNYVLQGNSVAAVDPVSRIVRQVIPIPH